MKKNSLEALCSQYFTWADLISAGETAGTSPMRNLPRAKRTFDALASMAAAILDPIVLNLNRPTITYAFSGPSNISKIRRKIAPTVDQHASFECWPNGNRICPIGGAAVDFFVPGRTSIEVASFVITMLDFDALYFYGPEKPIHVSWSESPRGLVVEMKFNEKHQRHFPVRRSPERFLELYGR